MLVSPRSCSVNSGRTLRKTYCIMDFSFIYKDNPYAGLPEKYFPKSSI